MAVSTFCLFCGSCSGLCHPTLTHSGKVHSIYRVVYTKLHVSKAAKGSKWSPCTNVPTACLVKSCTKWLCTYALHSHMQAAHPIMAPLYFIVGEEE